MLAETLQTLRHHCEHQVTMAKKYKGPCAGAIQGSHEETLGLLDHIDGQAQQIVELRTLVKRLEKAAHASK